MVLGIKKKGESEGEKERRDHFACLFLFLIHRPFFLYGKNGREKT